MNGRCLSQLIRGDSGVGKQTNPNDQTADDCPVTVHETCLLNASEGFLHSGVVAKLLKQVGKELSPMYLDFYAVYPVFCRVFYSSIQHLHVKVSIHVNC